MFLGQGVIRQGIHPVEAKKTLAEWGTDQRNSTPRLLEDETVHGERLKSSAEPTSPLPVVPDATSTLPLYSRTAAW